MPIISEKRYFQEKFCKGLNIKPESKLVNLDRITLYGSTYINASHASSLIDILIGSFRFCVNNPNDNEASKERFPKLRQMTTRVRNAKHLKLEDLGIIVRPKDLLEPYTSEYKELLNNLKNLLT